MVVGCRSGFNLAVRPRPIVFGIVQRYAHIGQPVYDLMVYEGGPSWGGESWAYGANGNGTTTINPFFPTNLQPTTTLLIGLVNNLENDGGAIADPV